MKRVTMMMMMVIIMAMMVGCGEQEPIEEIEVTVDPNYYTMTGRYYESGRVVDEFGEEWCYEWIDCEDTIYDGMPVKIVMSDSGTDLLYDDEVLTLVYDRETAIYDELEASFSEVEEWEVTRDGNNIRIGIE